MARPAARRRRFPGSAPAALTAARKAPPRNRSAGRSPASKEVASARRGEVPLPLTSRGRGLDILLFALVPLAAAIVYWNSLGNGFVWDDRFLIVDNPRVQSLSHLPELLTHDYVFVAETDLAYGYFRPVSSLSLALDYSLWGARPWGFHLTNLLLHAAASLLACGLALGLGARRAIAWATGLLFALHPIHTENVAWIAGRTDILAFLFGGGAFGLYLMSDEATSSARRRGLFVSSLISFALALLAKEMAAAVLFWIASDAFMKSADRPLAKRIATALRRAMPWLAVLALYAVTRFALLGVPPPAAPAEHTLARALWSAPSTIVRYLAWMAWPRERSAYVQNPYVTSLADPRLGVALVALILIGALLLRWARRSNQPRAVAGAGAMLALTFLPILNFARIAGPPDMGAVMAERFAYMPSFFFLLLVVLACDALVQRFPVRRARAALVAVFLLCVSTILSAQTIARNRDWQDDIRFFEQEARRTPGAPLLWTNLAQAQMRAGNPVAANESIRHAEALMPQATWVLAVRAQWLTLAGRYAEALPIQERVVHAEKKNSLALNNLAFLQRSTGHVDLALPVLRDLVERLPTYPDPWLNLAEIDRAAGDREAAVTSYTRYLDLRPRDLRAVEVLAGLLSAAGRAADAEALYLGAMRGDSFDASLWNNLGAARLASGDSAGALAAIERALGIDPAQPLARFNRAKLLALSGRVEESRAIYSELVREAPDSTAGASAARELAGMEGPP
ncbi:MAG: tetratricopeptide repeat protein [Thermoanaerobaculia bacterium]